MSERVPRGPSALGQFIIDEYTRRHHRWNATALAEAAKVDRGTMYLVVRGYRSDGTPVQQWPDTLRAIAHAIASGDSDPDAGEHLYARLLDLAGYLPSVPYVPCSANTELAERLRVAEARIEHAAQDAVAEYRRQLAEQILTDETSA